ncbi:MAG TPA: tetratricopeptide repeat protein, partial [Patescibacteria group bacterium]|nr:tetratricopeptide repeat protein [Patescibacteria group bacterium]
ARAHSVKFFLPLSLRLENAVVSCILYLSKTVWPVRLAVFYPHPNTRYNLPAIDASHPASEQWPIWSVSLAALALLAGSLALLKWRRRMPWAFVGWCWFLGTLVPVIGIIQVGIQAMADRYTYIPSIGLFAAIVWSAAHWSGASAIGRKLNTGATALILAACGLVAHTQAGYWHDDFTLFKHALNVTTNNAMAECHVGIGLAKQGRLDLAEEHFKAALLDDPFFYMAHSSLGTVYEVQTRFDEAVQQYQAVLKIRPWDDFARVRLAGVLHKLGRDNEAVAEYKRDLGENPDSIDANYELGSLLLDRGDLDSAGVYLSKTVDLKPNHVDALLCLSDVRARQGKLAAAEDALRAVVKIYPANAELRINLASLLWQAGQKTEALQQYTEAVRLQPAEPIGHYDLAIAYASSGKISDAIRELGKALQLKHDYTEALSELAWLLSTSPRAEERNGPQALTLARRALELGATNQPRAWAALDVASAENGQFAEAIKAAQKARDLALSQGQTNAAQIAEQRLQLYSSGKPFHLQ